MVPASNRGRRQLGRFAVLVLVRFLGGVEVMNNVYSKGLPYHSQVMIKGVMTTATLLTVTAGSVLAFSYAIGDALGAPAGFDASWGPATYAQTNLQQPRVTNGDRFLIKGIQIKPTNDSEAAILRGIYDDSDVTLETEGGGRIVHLGRLADIPGGNNLVGAFNSRLRPGINSREGSISFGNSGVPKGGPDSMFKIPNGFVWQPGNTADSQMVCRITTTKTFTVIVPVARVVSATGDAYDPPVTAGVDMGTYARLTVRLIGESTS